MDLTYVHITSLIIRKGRAGDICYALGRGREYGITRKKTGLIKKGLTSEPVNPFYLFFLRCRDAELNCGHEDFQSSALPTELSRHCLESLITFQVGMVKMNFV
jgi:hypothetical protein